MKQQTKLALIYGNKDNSGMIFILTIAVVFGLIVLIWPGWGSWEQSGELCLLLIFYAIGLVYMTWESRIHKRLLYKTVAQCLVAFDKNAISKYHGALSPTIYKDNKDISASIILEMQGVADLPFNPEQTRSEILQFGTHNKLSYDRLYELLNRFEEFLLARTKTLSRKFPKQMYDLRYGLLNDYKKALIDHRHLLYKKEDFPPEKIPYFKFAQFLINTFYLEELRINDYTPNTDAAFDLNELEEYLNKNKTWEDIDPIENRVSGIAHSYECKIEELKEKIRILESDKNKLIKENNDYLSIIIRNRNVLSHEVAVQELPNYNDKGELRSRTTFITLLKNHN